MPQNARYLRELRTYLLEKGIQRWIQARASTRRGPRGNLTELKDIQRALAHLFAGLEKEKSADKELGFSTGSFAAVFRELGIECTREEFEAFHQQLTAMARPSAWAESELVVSTAKNICPRKHGIKVPPVGGELSASGSDAVVPFSYLFLTARRKHLLDMVMGGMEKRSRLQMTHALEMPRKTSSEETVAAKLDRMKHRKRSGSRTRDTETPQNGDVVSSISPGLSPSPTFPSLTPSPTFNKSAPALARGSSKTAVSPEKRSSSSFSKLPSVELRVTHA
mmetsp:Transcript_7667/g.17708  ORF Transcript_7667/g.17708 Transcript_7667/m.17708 type:complete len:279 (+) Transcript_7667:66-902(+)|eukprot:CAMPEP_0114553326 /NCGR_PEP_ID=MMETSP0114-20121206/7595_1 /TAXON_ID=31324 /ORGANISM="Goniomonas sp, Strain m" /LENGTH=278 /DNA_ID=CAMNT_0001738255 /DNA_START=66 /DNA_END=902 /DNA_ORIENTATION=+